jgi:flagellar motor switch protein FliN/FliY
MGKGPWPADASLTRGPADVEIELSVRLGTAQLTLAEVAGLAQGQVIELDRFIDDPVDLLLNGQLVARGEVALGDDGPTVVVTEVLE